MGERKSTDAMDTVTITHVDCGGVAKQMPANSRAQHYLVDPSGPQVALKCESCGAVVTDRGRLKLQTTPP